MTDVPWSLPTSWRWARFEEVAYVAAALTDPTGFPDLPHIAPNHIEAETGRLLPYATVAEDGVTSAKHLFHPGDILYSKIRPYLAKVAVAPTTGLCSADMYPVRTHSEVSGPYLRWWMLTREFTRRAAGEQARTVLPKINKRSLYELPVPVPSLDEQWRIVDLLEDHLSRLDAAEANLRDAARRLVAFDREFIQQTVSAGSDVQVPLGSLIKRVEAGKSFGGSAPPASGDDWGVIRVSAMTWGEFRPQENKAVPAELVNPAYEIAPGDLLVSRANTTAYVGAPVLVRRTPRRRLLSDKSLRLVPRPDVDPEWLVAVLSAPSTRRQISALATGTSDSMRNISQKNLLAVRVPWEESVQQAEVVRRLAHVHALTNRLEYELARGRNRSVVLRRALLEAAFSGRLTGHSTDAHVVEELAGVAS